MAVHIPDQIGRPQLEGAPHLLHGSKVLCRGESPKHVRRRLCDETVSKLREFRFRSGLPYERRATHRADRGRRAAKSIGVLRRVSVCRFSSTPL
jgi:hypothetical protein